MSLHFLFINIIKRRKYYQFYQQTSQRKDPLLFLSNCVEHISLKSRSNYLLPCALSKGPIHAMNFHHWPTVSKCKACKLMEYFRALWTDAITLSHKYMQTTDAWGFCKHDARVCWQLKGMQVNQTAGVCTGTKQHVVFEHVMLRQWTNSRHLMCKIAFNSL